MLWINGKMTELTKKDAIHKLVDAKCFLERYSNPHDKWTEAINIGIEAIEIVMAQEEQEPTTKSDLGVEEVTALTEWIEKLTKECEDAYNKGYTDGMKALEQELILDKIRAEIEEYKSRQLTLAIGVEDLEEGKQIALEYVLAILNKYKAESEK